MAALDRMAREAQSERKFATGASTSRAISTWFATLPKTVFLAVIAIAPLFAWNWWNGVYDDSTVATDPFDMSTTLILNQLIETACGQILAGMVIYIAFKRLMREPSAIGTAISTGMRRFVPLLITGLITASCIALPLVAMFALANTNDIDTMAMLVPLVAIVGGIATIIVSTMFAAAAGAIIIESLGPIAAIKRSLQLTKGFRIQIFGCSLLVGIVAMIVGGLLGLVLNSVLTDILPFIPMFVALVVTPLTATLAAVVYHDLRTTKEGVDVAELSRVFT